MSLKVNKIKNSIERSEELPKCEYYATEISPPMKRTKLVPPDGGWGWFVVFGVAISNMVSQALISIFGLLFGDRLLNTGHDTTSAALLLNFQTATSNFSGLLTAPVIKRFSCRKVAAAGSLLTFIGYMLTTQTTELWQMMITYSFLTGLGLGLLSPSTFVIVNMYFTSKKGRAVGMSLAGTGCGQMLMPHLVKICLDNYGFNGALMIIGALSLNGFVGALLYQPVKWHMKKMEDPEQVPLQEESKDSDIIKKEETIRRNISAVSLCSVDGLPPSTAAVASNVFKKSQEMTKTLKASPIQEKEEGEEEDVHIAKAAKSRSAIANCWESFSRNLDLDLLKDPVFINLTIGLAIAYTCSVSFSMVFPFFMQNEINMTRGQTATSMSLQAAFDILGRIVVPVITDRLNWSNRLTFLISVILLAICRIIIAFQTEYIPLLITIAITGCFRATSVTNLNLSVSEYVPLEKLPAALGLNMINNGVCILLFGPLIGWLRDYTKSYRICIISLCILAILAMMSWTVEFIFCGRKKRHQPISAKK